MESALDSKSVYFSGSLVCLKLPDILSSPMTSKAQLGGKIAINYSIKARNSCYIGDYSYSSDMPINISGHFDSGIYYLMEYGKDKKSTGLFMLEKIGGPLRGVWIGVPSRKILTVD